MIDPRHPIAKLARKDGRYHPDAYAFVFDALAYAHSILDLGTERPTEAPPRRPGGQQPGTQKPSGKKPSAKQAESSQPDSEEEGASDRHLTGQELCGAIRQYALDQYGYLAKCVFNSWGVHRTGDFGEIVFKLIEVGQMRKTPTDRREDFEGVFDFDEDLVQGYKITLPE